MATSYTALLGLALPVTGELQGTWGDTVNNQLTSLLDTAVAGTTTISTDADVTLSTTTGAANQARQAIILWTANGSTTRNITAPAQSKTYVVINASAGTQSIVIRGVGPTTGVTIANGEKAVIAWNGSDFIKVSTFGGDPTFGNVTVTGTTTLSGLTASTALALNASKEVVSVTNTGTGNNVLSASPTLTGTVAGASMTLSSLTSGRVTYAGASGLLQDNANFTFNGTDLTVSGAVNAGSVNATTLDLTNLEVTNIKAKDGTASATIADSTGVMTIASAVLTTADINGGTMDNVTIGGATPAAGNFTNLDATGTLAVDGNVTLGDASTDTVTVNGRMGIGAAGLSHLGLFVSSSAVLSGQAISVASIRAGGTFGSDVTSDGSAFLGKVNTAAASFTLANARGLFIDDATKGAGSTITNQHGVYIADQTQGTNNYGITSAVSSGANKWNIYASGTANNAFAGNVRIGSTTAPTNALDVTGAMTVSGNVTLGDASTDTVTVNGYMGVGGAASSDTSVYVRSSALTGTTQWGVLCNPIASSAATSGLRVVQARAQTAASAFTAANVYAFYADNAALGSTSAITNQYGLYVVDQTQGTNNYGITSAVSSGTNKWNIYASGTAANYFAGNVLVGTTTTTNNVPGGTTSTLVSVIKGDASFGGPMYTAYSGTTSANSRGNVHYYQRSRGTTDGDMTAVASGDALCRLVFRGSDGANFRPAASIEAFVDGAVTGGGADDMPGRLSFHTSVDGTSNITERLRIDSSGALIAKPAAGVGAVFNEDGVDADFRVESDTNTHALFVQGSDGNVGIGTSSPSVSGLDVSRATGSATPTPVELRLATTTSASDWSTTDPWGRISFYSADASSGGAGLHAAIQTTATGSAGGVSRMEFLVSDNANKTLFKTLEFTPAGTNTTQTIFYSGSGTERLRIDSSGNLGLGVTPSAWASSFKAMQLGAGGYISGRTNTDEVYVGANSYFDTTDNRWEYIVTDVATQYYQDAGAHVWRTAPSGTAGNAITFTEKARIDSDGLKFNGDTAAANALDDYEEGTFTPTIVGSTTAGTGTYTTQIGKYTKIGNRVIVNLTVVWSAHTGTGNMRVGGLPFTLNATGYTVAACLVTNLTATGTVFVETAPSQTYCNVYAVNNGTSAALAIDTAATFEVSFAYEV